MPTPQVCNARLHETPDIDVLDDTRGGLQDVHRIHFDVGSFPTCMLGNIMSVRLFAAANARPGVADGLAGATAALLSPTCTSRFGPTAGP